MAMTLRAVIFDLDGILADSEPWWTKIDASLLAEHGVTYRGEHHRDVLGVNYRQAIEFYRKTFAISASTEAMMQRRGEIAAGFFADRIGLFPGVSDVLGELQAMGLRLAVATSSVGSSARPFLARHGLTRFFEVIVTGDEVERGKPHPDIYLRAAGALDLPAAKCLVIEDSLSGITAGKAAGMRVVGIPDTRFVDLRDYQGRADHLLSALAEIPGGVRDLRES